MSAIGNSSAIELEMVIFATDFSPASYNAGLYASAIAGRLAAGLVVAHSFTLDQAALEVETEGKQLSKQRIDLQHDLTLASDNLATGVGKTEAVLLEGDPRHTIPDFGRSKPASLVVLGTHGGGSIDRFVLGSTAEGVLKNLIGAAVTIGPMVNILDAGTLNIRRVLYATDCSTEAARAALAAVAISEAFDAELDILNVVRSSDIDDHEQLKQLKKHFYDAVASIVPNSVGQICEPRTFVSVGEPKTEILKHIDDQKIDLLILGLRRNAHLGMQIAPHELLRSS